ncbi:MAG: NAD(P)-binding domain-containing protein, partial [Pseudomonadota bacterium]
IHDETIGFIGLGAMGKGMASNCVRKGFKLVVHDIRPEPVAELTELGAGSAGSIRELSSRCSTIVTGGCRERQV